MKNFKKLSREDLRNVNGGKACSLTVQQPNGSWVTYQGQCKGVVDDYTISSNGSGGTTIQITASHRYCEAGFGEVALSSNGGVSRC